MPRAVRTKASLAPSAASGVSGGAPAFDVEPLLTLLRDPYGLLFNEPCDAIAHLPSRRNCAGNPHCVHGLGADPRATYKRGIWADNYHAGTLRSTNPALSARDIVATPAGLVNLGATCYMNSFFQVLFMLSEFRDAIMSWSATSIGTPPGIDALAGAPVASAASGAAAVAPRPLVDTDVADMQALQLMFAYLTWSRRAAYAPRHFVQTFKLSTSEQQDVQEFNTQLMTHVDNILKKQGNAMVDRLFGGSSGYVTRCNQCRNASSRLHEFKEVTVPIADTASIEDSLAQMMEPEQLTHDNLYYCEHCGRKVPASRQLEFARLPPVLQLQLTRFAYDPEMEGKRKVQTPVEIPDIIDMGRLVASHGSPVGQPGEEFVYELVAALYHKGGTAHAGHYVADVWDEQRGQWFHFDDAVVTPSSASSSTGDDVQYAVPVEMPAGTTAAAVARAAAQSQLLAALGPEYAAVRLPLQQGDAFVTQPPASIPIASAIPIDAVSWDARTAASAPAAASTSHVDAATTSAPVITSLSAATTSMPTQDHSSHLLGGEHTPVVVGVDDASPPTRGRRARGARGGAQASRASRASATAGVKRRRSKSASPLEPAEAATASMSAESMSGTSTLLALIPPAPIAITDVAMEVDVVALAPLQGAVANASVLAQLPLAAAPPSDMEHIDIGQAAGEPMDLAMPLVANIVAVTATPGLLHVEAVPHAQHVDMLLLPTLDDALGDNSVTVAAPNVSVDTDAVRVASGKFVKIVENAVHFEADCGVACLLKLDDKGILSAELNCALTGHLRVTKEQLMQFAVDLSASFHELLPRGTQPPVVDASTLLQQAADVERIQLDAQEAPDPSSGRTSATLFDEELQHADIAATSSASSVTKFKRRVGLRNPSKAQPRVRSKPGLILAPPVGEMVPHASILSFAKPDAPALDAMNGSARSHPGNPSMHLPITTAAAQSSEQLAQLDGVAAAPTTKKARLSVAPADTTAPPPLAPTIPAPSATSSAAPSASPSLAGVKLRVKGAADTSPTAKWTATRSHPSTRAGTASANAYMLVYRRLDAERLASWQEWAHARTAAPAVLPPTSLVASPASAKPRRMPSAASMKGSKKKAQKGADEDARDSDFEVEEVTATPEVIHVHDDDEVSPTPAVKPVGKKKAKAALQVLLHGLGTVFLHTLPPRRVPKAADALVDGSLISQLQLRVAEDNNRFAADHVAWAMDAELTWQAVMKRKALVASAFADSVPVSMTSQAIAAKCHDSSRALVLRNLMTAQEWIATRAAALTVSSASGSSVSTAAAGAPPADASNSLPIAAAPKPAAGMVDTAALLSGSLDSEHFIVPTNWLRNWVAGADVVDQDRVAALSRKRSRDAARSGAFVASPALVRESITAAEENARQNAAAAVVDLSADGGEPGRTDVIDISSTAEDGQDDEDDVGNVEGDVTQDRRDPNELLLDSEPTVAPLVADSSPAAMLARASSHVCRPSLQMAPLLCAASDGTLVLPPGLQLSQIKVISGRTLRIALSDTLLPADASEQAIESFCGRAARSGGAVARTDTGTSARGKSGSKNKTTATAAARPRGSKKAKLVVATDVANGDDDDIEVDAAQFPVSADGRTEDVVNAASSAVAVAKPGKRSREASVKPAAARAGPQPLSAAEAARLIQLARWRGLTCPLEADVLLPVAAHRNAVLEEMWRARLISAAAQVSRAHELSAAFKAVPPVKSEDAQFKAVGGYHDATGASSVWVSKDWFDSMRDAVNAVTAGSRALSARNGDAAAQPPAPKQVATAVQPAVAWVTRAILCEHGKLHGATKDRKRITVRLLESILLRGDDVLGATGVPADVVTLDELIARFPDTFKPADGANAVVDCLTCAEDARTTRELESAQRIARQSEAKGALSKVVPELRDSQGYLKASTSDHDVSTQGLLANSVYVVLRHAWLRQWRLYVASGDDRPVVGHDCPAWPVASLTRRTDECSHRVHFPLTLLAYLHRTNPLTFARRRQVRLAGSEQTIFVNVPVPAADVSAGAAAAMLTWTHIAASAALDPELSSSLCRGVTATTAVAADTAIAAEPVEVLTAEEAMCIMDLYDMPGQGALELLNVKRPRVRSARPAARPDAMEEEAPTPMSQATVPSSEVDMEAGGSAATPAIVTAQDADATDVSTRRGASKSGKRGGSAGASRSRPQRGPPPPPDAPQRALDVFADTHTTSEMPPIITVLHAAAAREVMNLHMEAASLAESRGEAPTDSSFVLTGDSAPDRIMTWHSTHPLCADCFIAEMAAEEEARNAWRDGVFYFEERVDTSAATVSSSSSGGARPRRAKTGTRVAVSLARSCPMMDVRMKLYEAMINQQPPLGLDLDALLKCSLRAGVSGLELTGATVGDTGLWPGDTIFYLLNTPSANLDGDDARAAAAAGPERGFKDTRLGR